MDMFHQDDYAEASQTGLATVVSQTYEESVRDLIQDERHYLRDLHMIIKVKRRQHIILPVSKVIVTNGYYSTDRYSGRKSQSSRKIAASWKCSSATSWTFTRQR